uniref:Cuticle protein 6 n=1 Tax=Scylla olivacea TaxID=85551 RepID=A0A0P4WCR0_SCYOL
MSVAATTTLGSVTVPQRVVCILAVVGACWGEAALHPETRQGPQHDLHSIPRYDLYDNRHYSVYNNPRLDVYNDLDNNLYRASPVGLHNGRHVSDIFHHAPVVPPHHSTFNAPAITSYRGPTVVPAPYLVPPQVHNVLPVHESPVIIEKTPVPYASPVPQPKPVIPIRSQYHVQDELGQYSFGYDAGISTRQETRDAYGNVRGSFSYIDSNGKLQTQHYTAGKGGFRVVGTNLPVHVTNEARHKRSYATFPAATAPLTAAHHLPDLNLVTPYHVYGPPRQSFSYSLQSLPSQVSTSTRTYYAGSRVAPHHRRHYYYY